MTLRVLYNNLEDNTAIKLHKRISTVEHNEGKVTIICSDGTTTRGNILVGYDGVHSIVRREMWRLDHVEEQKSFERFLDYGDWRQAESLLVHVQEARQDLVNVYISLIITPG